MKSILTIPGDVVTGGPLVVAGGWLELENPGRGDVMLPLTTKDDPGWRVGEAMNGSVLRTLGGED